MEKEIRKKEIDKKEEIIEEEKKSKRIIYKLKII